MQPPKTFQMVLTGVFVVLLVLGFLGFSGKLSLPGGSKEVNYGTVTMWGTMPSKTIEPIIGAKLAGNKSVAIKYTEKSVATFDADFIEALATGVGPDIILLPQDELLKKLNKLNVVSYQTITERTFKDTFLQEGEIFLRPDGIVAIPFTLDPIVMYWNRDIFTNAGVVTPPMLWKQFYDLAPRITASDSNGNISRSLTSLGGYRNVSNAKEILSIFIMQAGAPIVARSNGSLVASMLASDTTSAENPVVSAVRFFMEFSKKEKGSYSWNSSLPDSRSMFESGDLATYFGYASEYPSIKQKNPHLNFDVAVVPQAENAPVKLTFGRMHGLAITLASQNPQGALYAELLLSGKDVVGNVSSVMGLPPVRRDLISVRPSDAALSVFYDSAIISRAWYDPSPAETNRLFMNMIDEVTSGRLDMARALLVTQEGLSSLLKFYR